MKLDLDATEFAWITTDQVNNYDFIDGIQQEIEQINEILKSRKSQKKLKVVIISGRQ
ncbi:MAG: hypothetical protein WD896_01465 [Parcubacteria group bacterium]